MLSSLFVFHSTRMDSLPDAEEVGFRVSAVASEEEGIHRDDGRNG